MTDRDLELEEFTVTISHREQGREVVDSRVTHRSCELESAVYFAVKQFISREFSFCASLVLDFAEDCFCGYSDAEKETVKQLIEAANRVQEYWDNSDAELDRIRKEQKRGG